MDVNHNMLSLLKYIVFTQKHIYSLMKDLDDAQKAIEEGNALEPVLRQRIEDLEEDKKDLMV